MNAPNAAAPLDITTYVEGNDEVVHPSVIDAGEAGWNGYRYWLAATPYPNTDSAFENPCIWASHDGIAWVVPTGLTNPVEAAPATGYWSDPHLVLRGGTLHLYFRGVGVPGVSGEIVALRTSTDGVTWTPRATVLTLDPFVRRCLSPAIWCETDGTWRMWFVDIVPSPYVVQMYTAAAPQGPWSHAATCRLPAPDGKQLWHLDVQKRSGVYCMLLNVTDTSSSAGGLVYVARSIDGVTWRRDPRPLISTRGGEWDAGLYRSCWVPRDGRGWRIWYGSATPAWFIGYTESPHP